MNIWENFNQMMHSRNFKNGILYTVFSFVNNGISFILLLILARYLMPSDYGALNLFNTFVTLLNIFISLCTTAYVSVAYFQVDRNTLQQIIAIGLGTTTLILLLMSIFLALGVSFVERVVGIDIEFLWLGLFICYFQVFTNLNLEIWRLEENPVSYGVFSLFIAISSFILTFWLIVGKNQGWEGRVYAQWLVMAIFFVVSLIFLIKRRYLVITILSATILKETYLYAFPLIPHMMSFWLRQGLDRYIINYFHEQAAVGYFSFAMNVSVIITMIGNAFNATNSVYIYKCLANGYDSCKVSLQRQTKLMTFLFWVITLCVILFAFGLIYWVLPHYRESLRYVIPLCIGGFFQCIYLLWVNYLFFYKKTHRLMFITITTSVFQAVLSVWLTRYSVFYTAIISMGITGVTMLMVWFDAKRLLNRELINENSL